MNQTNPIIHSNLAYEDAIKGSLAPKTILDSLKLLDVEYYNFSKELCRGQILVHRRVANDVTELFNKIKENKFPVNKVVPIVAYNWDDDASMTDNNSSGFNYRVIKGTTHLSNHSQGLAIDLNPFQNPYFRKSSSSKIMIEPPGSKYNPLAEGTITEDMFITRFLKSRGWSWGGTWTSSTDYQHFEKAKRAR